MASLIVKADFCLPTASKLMPQNPYGNLNLRTVINQEPSRCSVGSVSNSDNHGTYEDYTVVCIIKLKMTL